MSASSLRLPDPCLVVLVGATGAGKTHWAATWFQPDEIVSSDRLRAVVGAGERDQRASKDAFELLDLIAEGDRVVAHMPYTGTFAKPISDVSPTGRSARVDEMVIFRIAGGKIAEAWEVYDEAGMWRQLGAAPRLA